MSEYDSFQTMQERLINKVGLMDVGELLETLKRWKWMTDVSVRMAQATESDLATYKFITLMLMVIDEVPGIKDMMQQIISDVREENRSRSD